MAVLFISDLHLGGEQLTKLPLFERFLARAAQDAEALYILGDLFELWLGDDDDSPGHAEIITALAGFTAGGRRLYIAHGNRDFLLCSEFYAATGALPLAEYHVEEFNGVRTLLTHGDLLCTDDVDYQRFRAQVRDPAFVNRFLAMPLAERRAIAAQTRAGTTAAMLEKDMNIMDAAQPAIEAVMREHGVTRLIHGHTHRPGMHRFAVDGKHCERYVLGDWYTQESVARLDGESIRLLPIADYLA